MKFNDLNAFFFWTAVICYIIAGASTPVAIVYGVYSWAVDDVIFKVALWEAVKLWMWMLSALIPAFVIHLVIS